MEKKKNYKFIIALAFFGLSIGAVNAQVCSIGTNTYATLDLALAAVPTGGTTPTTIKLLANIDYSSELIISNKKITFELNGKNLNVVNTTNYALLVESGGNIFLSGVGNFNVTSTVSRGTYINADYDKATVTNVTGSTVGAYARQGATLAVFGNVTATGTYGIGAYADGGSAGGTKITINGTITVPATGTYIMVGITAKTKANYEAVTTKVGYFTYTDGSNTVWVKDPSSSAVESVEAQNLNIYVANGELKIVGDVPFDNLPFTIYNLSGNQIVNGQWLNGKSINVATLASGVYFLKIGEYREKFIKE